MYPITPMPPSSSSAPMMYAIQTTPDPPPDASLCGMTAGALGTPRLPGVCGAAVESVLGVLGGALGVCVGFWVGSGTEPVTTNWCPPEDANSWLSPLWLPPSRPEIARSRLTCTDGTFEPQDIWYWNWVEPPGGLMFWLKIRMLSVPTSLPLLWLMLMPCQSPLARLRLTM